MKRTLLHSALFLAIIVATIGMLGGNKMSLAGNLHERKEVQDFIDEMAQRHGFSTEALSDLFSKTETKENIIAAISRPAESKPWFEYRPIFLTERRIRRGAEFLKTHRQTLLQAEKVYGVPPEIVTAILGVETFYGNQTGGYRVIDALATLAFDYPPRSGFFRGELEQFLLMSREEQIDPLSLTGSYAGAMGKTQFIASSFRSYAVDFDGDEHKDLWNNTADAIGSIAHYLKRHGWERKQPVAFRAGVTENDDVRAVLDAGLRPQISIAELKKKGVSIDGTPAETARGALIELETPDGHEYWVGLNNFYVITRYNHSALYAMAVFQLSEEIARAGRGLTAGRLVQ